MSTDCTPIASLPNITKLFRDFLNMGVSAANASIRGWYGADPLGSAWMQPPTSGANTTELADALERQSLTFGAGSATLANIAKLRAGARIVVTGQQVVLLGGPLLTLLKAATAIARAKQATAETGIDHVPIFWLATEDHDFEEVDQVSLLSKSAVETLHLAAEPAHNTAPVGAIVLPESIHALLDKVSDLLHHAPICDLLRQCYADQSASGTSPTFANTFARLMTYLFSEQGLIVLDASARDFHTLGASTLRFAIEHAEELEAALLTRSAELEAAGYHAQVLVKPGASLLFLIREGEGALSRQTLHRMPDGSWTVGTGNSATSYSSAELLAILDATPERLSPNALLRAVFQDTILPTTAYIGGPAEVAYFAQSAVIYQRILGRITPILPRLTATLIEPAIATVMAQHEVSLTDAMTTGDELALRLAARALPIEAKRRLADAGNALDAALSAAQEYLGGLDASLGRAAEVSTSKMRYQMDRLRRLAATTEMQREASLRKHADAITLHLFPNGQLQERVLAGVWFLAAWESVNSNAPDSTMGAGLIARLVEEAASQQSNHLAIRL